MDWSKARKKTITDDLFGPNLGYLIDQYERYLRNSSEVEQELKELFEEMDEEEIAHLLAAFPDEPKPQPGQNESMLGAAQLAENIRKYGHLAANIYPLGNIQLDISHLELDRYGLTEVDLKKLPAGIICKEAFLENQTALDAFHYLKKVYTGPIAYEFDHVHDVNEKNWLIQRIEGKQFDMNFSIDKRRNLLKRLAEVEGFEKFLHKTFVGQKRFSIEGLDAMVPLIEEMITEAVKKGARYVNIGMAHRGRLNVLAHILRKPYEMIFAEFQHAPNKELVPSEGSIGINFGWTGDVKYHLGLNRQLSDQIGRAKITLANNPSHLEYVGAVVEGFTRAAQDDKTKPGFPTEDYKSALAILIHGDAAFPGEGIVAETLNLSRLKGYRTGGTIHIISNNMIGFTTESADSRSTRYASDLAKGYEIPIIHVNADDPEACIRAAVLAVEYRSVFQKDFLIDLIGYRRFGHNEMDEPMTTSPQMYTMVNKHPTVMELYADKLKNEDVINELEMTSFHKEITERLEAAHHKVLQIKKDEEAVIPEPPAFNQNRSGIEKRVTLETLKLFNDELLQWPNGVRVFHKLEKILKRRAEAFGKQGKVDWALAESLAFAAILADGTPIRLSGQDTERGTFAHRNLVLHDEQTGKTFVPLNHLSTSKASFAVYNSPLTEAAVLGFEYGYNVFSPESLVIWEAQYGDFANAAQVMFDQFIAAGMAKWGQKSGLVMLLPHGYEGQGPEHSSARLERFLQSSAEKNWRVANLTSASQYFHILRRQASLLKREEIRPLVIMSPKSLLRNPLTASSGTELSEGEFKPVLEHFTGSRDDSLVQRIVLCTGKIAIDIAEQIKDGRGYEWLQVVRVEEIYPFPSQEIKDIFTKYQNVKEVIWVQEEPKNMGAWTFVEPRINELLPNGIHVAFNGRRRRSSPAEGEPTIHKLIQSKILSAALTRDEEGGSHHG